MLKININLDLCEKCGTCVQICPEKVFAQGKKESVAEVAHESMCIACGQCVAVCPKGAIEHVDFPEGSIKPINQEVLPSPDQILEIIRARRSIRVFRDKPVEKELIEKIIDGARFAPTANNTQCTEYIVIREKSVLHEIVTYTADCIEKIIEQIRNPEPSDFDCWMEELDDFEMTVNSVKNGKDWILHDAPVLLLFHVDKNVGFAEVNANLALQNATFVSEALGIGSFYTGYVVAACEIDERIPQLLSLPDGHKIYGGLALGYPKIKFKNWIERKSPQITWM